MGDLVFNLNYGVIHRRRIRHSSKKMIKFIKGRNKIKSNQTYMRKFILISFIAGALVFVWQASAAGFDQFGYNYKARIFTGKADGVDRNLDGKIWGDAAYANDHLVMKWSKAWDEARFGGKPWTAEAWEDNEWNGMGPDGSKETWHYKIIWVGPALQNSPYWREGGYPVWGQFEVILSQGTAGKKHIWETHAVPTGYGGN